MPEILMFTSSLNTFATNHLCVQTTSAVLLSGRNPLCFFDKYLSTLKFGLILFRVMINKVFRNTFSRMIDRKLFRGPFLLPGFCMAINQNSCCVYIWVFMNFEGCVEIIGYRLVYKWCAVFQKFCVYSIFTWGFVVAQID